jgi:hypothetical protein
MTENKNIPLAIITSLIGDECKENWGIQNYGAWILKDKILQFTDLLHIYQKPLECNSFKENKFTIPGDVIALLLKGNTGDHTKPHQLEIIWHLLNIEKCKIEFILIHPGGGQEIGDDSKDGRALCDGLYSVKNQDKRRFHFANSESIPYFCYSLKGGTDEEKLRGQWIEEISKAIKCKVYKDAAENLNELYQLLKKYVENNYDEEILKKKPKPCLVFEIIDSVPALFLPIFIDINGLSELSIKAPYFQKEKMLREFLIDMIKYKEPHYYSNKLAEARFLIFGKAYETCDIDLGEFKDANLKETILALKSPVLRQVILETFGYTADSEITNLKEASTFMLLEFFYYMDSLIEEYKNEEITYAHVSNILKNYYESFITWFKKMTLSFSALISELKG